MGKQLASGKLLYVAQEAQLSAVGMTKEGGMQSEVGGTLKEEGIRVNIN